MFRITAETHHAFTFAEVLLLAAMNMESTRLAAESQSRSKTARNESDISRLLKFFYTEISKALQV